MRWTTSVSRVLWALSLALICSTFVSTLGYAEAVFPPGYKPATLKISNLDISQYPTVTCEIIFRDYSGNTIPIDENLSLRLYEDEIPITDVTVKSIREIATVLLIDTSGSMLGKMDKVADGVSKYLEGLGPDDEVMVMEFNSWRGDTPVVQDFTTDPELILEQIKKVKPRGQTALYDAISDGSDKFFPDHRDATKVIIVLSDGSDNNSVREWFTAIRFAKEHDIKVFFVALGPDADRRMFGRIARETHGKVYTAPTEESLPAAYHSISKSVSTKRTAMVYRTDPDFTADGRPHYVQVAVYKGATRWTESPLKSFKFRILKTAEQLAADEDAKKKAAEAAQARHEALEAEKAAQAAAEAEPKPEGAEAEKAKPEETKPEGAKAGEAKPGETKPEQVTEPKQEAEKKPAAEAAPEAQKPAEEKKQEEQQQKEEEQSGEDESEEEYEGE
ncbi:MAG: VWA domain-containing protein [Candidatus Coatesbacteria bacterium]|nr:VWA domain-containing protein [Candidatus Coatesbacteria bacterium]